MSHRATPSPPPSLPQVRTLVALGNALLGGTGISTVRANKSRSAEAEVGGEAATTATTTVAAAVEEEEEEEEEGPAEEEGADEPAPHSPPSKVDQTSAEGSGGGGGGASEHADPAGALAAFTRAIELNPTHVGALHGAGAAHYELGDEVASDASWSAALAAYDADASRVRGQIISYGEQSSGGGSVRPTNQPTNRPTDRTISTLPTT